MTLFFNIMFGIFAAVLFIGVIGEKDKERQTNIVIAFVTTLLFLFINNTIM